MDFIKRTEITILTPSTWYKEIDVSHTTVFDYLTIVSIKVSRMDKPFFKFLLGY